MKNPLKRYYFAAGETPLKLIDCTIDQWRWQNPQDAVTEVLTTWQEIHGPSVSVRSFTKI